MWGLGVNLVYAYSGGSGTKANPYKIATVSDWQQLMNTSSQWNKYFIMIADVNLQGITLTPVGDDITAFTGGFDGNDHIIYNVDINTPDGSDIGLFGDVYGGQIHNLGVMGVNISGYGDVGGLVGCIHGEANISNCYATGTVTGSGSVGGLVGYNSQSYISACCATGSVTGSDFVGGLVGENDLMGIGIITACYATGAVSGNSYVGGLVGENYYGSVTYCYATGAVSGSSDVGGLVGYSADGIATACFWDMETSGQTNSAGGMGLPTNKMKSVIIYQNAGWADKGWVINDGLDYPRLAWENTGGVPIPAPQPIPLSGSGTEQDPYQVWTAEDFALLSWYVSAMDKHIALMADLDLSGTRLYPIGDLGDFIGVFDGNGHIIRNAYMNIPCSYIGLFSYVGSEGQIRNLGVVDVNVSGQDYVGGLVVDSKGTVSNCYVIGAVNGGEWVSGLVGVNDTGSTITACYASVTVTAHGFAGGLAGENYGTITTSCSTTTISGVSFVGGLVGQNDGNINACATSAVSNGYDDVGGLVGANDYGTITACYATGAVTGNDYDIGGLVGHNLYGTITACYATGAVVGNSSVGGLVGWDYQGSISASFWDIETSGQTTSAGGEGKTTAEMKTLSTFTSAGWDFVGETASGTGNTWRMCVDGLYYPKLSWQFPLGDFVCPDGVDIDDLAIFVDQWLLKKLSKDVAPGKGDGIVNFIDWAVFANGWQGDMNDLADFASQWLQRGAYCADIAPAHAAGDGVVNMLDFAVFANNWLKGTGN
jgi:hypothetical protein